MVRAETENAAPGLDKKTLKYLRSKPLDSDFKRPLKGLAWSCSKLVSKLFSRCDRCDGDSQICE